MQRSGGGFQREPDAVLAAARSLPASAPRLRVAIAQLADGHGQLRLAGSKAPAAASTCGARVEIELLRWCSCDSLAVLADAAQLARDALHFEMRSGDAGEHLATDIERRGRFDGEIANAVARRRAAARVHRHGARARLVEGRRQAALDAGEIARKRDLPQPVAGVRAAPSPSRRTGRSRVARLPPGLTT